MLAITNHRTAFPRVVFLNVKRPVDADGNEVDPEMGPGEIGFYVTVPEVDADGTVTYSQGSVEELSPPDLSDLRESIATAKLSILEQVKQLHIAIAGDAMASGESRTQAMGDYIVDLAELSGVINAAGRWVLETAWYLAEYLSSTQRTDNIRATFACRLNPGPLTADMRNAIIKQTDAGLLSKQTGMSMLGVDDIEAERERIRKEMEEDIGPRDRAEIERTRNAIENDRVLRERANNTDRRIEEIEEAANNPPEGV